MRTLFHEFGHGLHGLLSQVTYERLSGTNVLRDFVELPSQIFEHWAIEPEVLKRHARHTATGEPIPDALIERLHAARRFNQGFETVEYTASRAGRHGAARARRDRRTASTSPRSSASELARIGMPREIGMRHRLPHFEHLFAGSGYAAGYYVYLWAEVLDADGYDAFVEAGDPFDPGARGAAASRYIYSAGGTRSIRRRRTARSAAATPAVEPMLRQRGLIEVET